MLLVLRPLTFAFARLLLLLPLLSGCGNGGVRDRFDIDAAVDSAEAGDGATLRDGALPDADPTLGAPCVDDKQCQNAAIACASFRCDSTIGRCRATPDDTRCDDGIYCNGQEHCDPRLGCQPGPAIDCTPKDICLVGACDESTRTCKSAPRDADGDGDPWEVCPKYGRDCDDRDPTVSSKTAEVCGNGIDDNCNGVVDETPCTTPASSTCDTAKLITASGTYSLSLAATKRSVGASCAPDTSWPRQSIVAIRVPAGAPQDVDVLATSVTFGQRVALAAATTCGDSKTETACTASPATTSAARLKLRSLSPGTYPVYVFGAAEIGVELRVTFGTPTAPASNLTCAKAEALFDVGATTVTKNVEVIDVGTTPSACTQAAGPLLYRFVVPSDGPHDLLAHATPSDTGAQAILGLRDASCVAATSELRCGVGGPATFFARALSPGVYYLELGTSVPNDVVLDASLLPASAAIAGDECTSAPALPLSATKTIDLSKYQADIAASCLGSPTAPSLGADAAYDLSLTETSDVLVVMHGAGGDQLGLGIASPACAAMDLGCGQGYPLRLQRRALAAGDYRVVFESASSSPVSISSFVRPAATPGPNGADGCAASPVVIPPTGGLFVGDTSTHKALLDESCDSAGEPKGGGPESIYRIDIAAKSRLLVDAWGSAFTTTLSIRQGSSCPGVEITNGCAAGYYPGNAFLDVTVDPGTYWIVVDGYALASGVFRLDVRVAPPVGP